MTQFTISFSPWENCCKYVVTQHLSSLLLACKGSVSISYSHPCLKFQLADCARSDAAKNQSRIDICVESTLVILQEQETLNKMPKKLKVVVKSLYSHEIRKDVSLENLKSLKLEDAWPFIREEIEIEIGSSQLVCIPHITEADLYKVTSLFVPNEKETNGKMFTPLGELRKNINEEKSDADCVKWLEQGDFQDADFKFPHESVKITLQDESIKNKVRVIMVNFTRNIVPRNKELVNNIYLDVENNKNLQGKKSVYMITNVLMAKTIEFRVTRGTSSRIFHLGNASPLVFGLEEFLIGDDGKLVAKEPVGIKSKLLHWKKVDSSDHLYIPDKQEAACEA